MLPFLLAFQCEEETESPLVFNNYKVAITSQASFDLNDTIWIEGSVSSKAFDVILNDSLFVDYTQEDQFLVMKFVQPSLGPYTKDAIDYFDLIYETGAFSFLPICENAQISALGELSDDQLFYNYKIGLKPLVPGDYVLSWFHAEIFNEDRNEQILTEYITAHNSEYLEFDKCGQGSSRIISESEREFYFTVE